MRETLAQFEMRKVTADGLTFSRFIPDTDGPVVFFEAFNAHGERHQSYVARISYGHVDFVIPIYPRGESLCIRPTAMPPELIAVIEQLAEIAF